MIFVLGAQTVKTDLQFCLPLLLFAYLLVHMTICRSLLLLHTHTASLTLGARIPCMCWNNNFYLLCSCKVCVANATERTNRGRFIIYQTKKQRSFYRRKRYQFFFSKFKITWFNSHFFSWWPHSFHQFKTISQTKQYFQLPFHRVSRKTNWQLKFPSHWVTYDLSSDISAINMKVSTTCSTFKDLTFVCYYECCVFDCPSY